MVKPFFTPDPPRIPGDPNPDSNEITDFWRDNASLWCTLLTKRVEGQFVCAKVDSNEYAPKLGPPSERRLWPVLMQKYGLQVLKWAGFLNHKTSQHLVRVDHEVHPAFKKDRWPGISDEDFKLLEPTLRWVSAVLEDHDILPFYAALMFQPLDTGHSKSQGSYQIYRPKTILSKEDSLETIQRLHRMDRHVSWYAKKSTEPIGFRTYGFSIAHYISDGTKKLAEVPKTSGSENHINHAFVDILRQYHQDNTKHHTFLCECQAENQVDADRCVNPCEHSAFLRTSFKMGITLIHEFTHAVSRAYRPRYTNERNITFREPFCNDDRINEVGFAIENFLLKGHADTMGGMLSRIEKERKHAMGFAMPFGMTLRINRDLDAQNLSHVRPRVPVDPKEVQYAYPVPQVYINEVLSKDQWEGGTMRYGMAFMAMPRLEKWKVRNHYVK